MEEQLKEKEAIEAENAATNAKLMENEAQVSAECLLQMSPPWSVQVPQN